MDGQIYPAKGEGHWFFQHTFNAGEYQKIFSIPIIEMKDGEIRII